MAKICTAAEAVKDIGSGMSVMIGGFLGVGTPDSLVGALMNQDTQNLTVIANDTAFVGIGVGRLQDSKQMAKLYASYIGGHPETGRSMENGELEVVLTPQGTLAEQIRAGGAGLGGFLTPAGVGTVVAQGKQEIVIGKKTYLLEMPLKADFALIKAYKADTSGNLIYRLSARNFNPLMAMAAKVVIVEAEEIVPVGSFEPDQVITPGIFIDFLVEGGK
ncbi:CoA transferase subunit A [Sporomusa malonica]|uniref:Acetate CoA/acetoacetate CoA-transferase alpha subunit n=1 Tax=Sporomusa malonica TaxID=112901 RepID=A0A1W2E2D8_9FIRM|nr:CoA transferase subunit A [Sporomusa malonica]SMD03238.1 acetate CoA/acetoacetate CoA-transferase alpha subunit [Sporomusa malonica]